MSDGTQQRQWRAIADLYHGFTTGFILTLVSRRDTDSVEKIGNIGTAGRGQSGAISLPFE